MNLSIRFLTVQSGNDNLISDLEKNFDNFLFEFTNMRLRLPRRPSRKHHARD